METKTRFLTVKLGGIRDTECGSCPFVVSRTGIEADGYCCNLFLTKKLAPRVLSCREEPDEYMDLDGVVCRTMLVPLRLRECLAAENAANQGMDAFLLQQIRLGKTT